MAVAMAINPFKTRVNASFSFSLGVPRCMVRVIVVVPSVGEIKMQTKKLTVKYKQVNEMERF